MPSPINYKQRTKDRIAAGVCTKCGRRKPWKDKKTCNKCLKIFKKYTLTHKEIISIKLRAKVQKRKSMGLCVYCPNKALKGKAYCRKHCKIKYLSDIKSQQRRKLKIIQEQKDRENIVNSANAKIEKFLRLNKGVIE